MANSINLSKRNLLRGKLRHKPEIRLPWVISEEVFTQNCTQCQKCVDVCETDIIIRDHNGFPKIDFSIDECTLCMKCVDVCEEPLFRTDRSEPSTPWFGHIEISDQCLAKNNIHCQSCKDACEPGAITFEYQLAHVPVPILSLPDCTQCGACISACPKDAISLNIEKEAQHVPINKRER